MHNLTDIRHGTPEWWDARAKNITGTDVAAIMGRAKWKTPLDIWYRLVLQQPEPKKETAFMKWGNLTEILNARELENLTGCTVVPNDRLARHPAFPIVGSPDAFIHDPLMEGAGIGEFKAPSAYTADEWEEGEAPVFYEDQVKLYMLATGCKWGVLSALVPPTRADDELIRTKRVEWAEGEEAAMVKAVNNWFHRHVLLEEQPDAIAGDMERLRSIHGKDEFRTVMLSDDDCLELAEVVSAKDDKKDAQRRHDDAKARLMQIMGNAIYATTPDGASVSWKTTAAGSRTFRLMKQLPNSAPPPQ